MKENTEKLNEGESAAKKAEAETALEELKKLLEGANYLEIKSATEKLSELSQALGAALYATNAAAGAGSEGAAQAAPEDGVEDAEIVDDAK